ncbi:MAG: SlyX family protein [Mariprofundaceae bacterium]|nr:SlyX family protein [Mariprofundaceae bacterium]
MSSAEERIVELETKLSFQEHLIQELNEALTHQQQQLDALQHRLDTMCEQMQTGLSDEIRPVSEEAPPPHY